VAKCDFLHPGYVTKANAGLEAIGEIAIAVRDDDTFWSDTVVNTDDARESPSQAYWKAIDTPEIAGAAGRLWAFRKPLITQPGVAVTIEIKLVVGDLKLRFSRVPLCSGVVLREARRGLRAIHKRYGVQPTNVPLVQDDSELGALVALRCVQQTCYGGAAHQVLRRYVRESAVPDGVVDDVLSRVVENFVSTYRSGALRKYTRLLGRAMLAAEAAALQRTTPRTRGDLLTINDASADLGVTPRTVYRWLKDRTLEPASRRPYLISVTEVERFLETNRPWTVYKAVMKLRGCSPDAARNWVQRRRAKDFADDEIIIEAKGEVPPIR
jgi:excisionase family DNA binding protein